MAGFRTTILTGLLVIQVCGCASIWHELKPHRLRRLNRTTAPSLDPEFTRMDSSKRTWTGHESAHAPSLVAANTVVPVSASFTTANVSLVR
ncbi:MAG: hypothetical protein FJ267_11730 [Planctomycetes bacterium]|nr:hypothetical protein [Planctomycetota bacterium]